MDDPGPILIALAAVGAVLAAAIVWTLARRVYWSEWVQERVLRWTGSSRRVMTAWGPVIAGRTGKGRRWI